jgi:hypothetical protein
VKVGVAVALAAMLAALPIIKNAIVFHSPSASSWVGLNLAQTATGLPLEQARHCDFLSAQREIAAQPAPSGLHPSLTGATKPSGYPNMNHIGLIARSAECAGIAQADIRAHFGAWLQQRIATFVHSHQLMSYNYVGDPRSRAAMELAERDLNPLSTAGRMTVLAGFLFLMFWCARQALRGKKRELHLCLFVLIGYFTVASHIANGVEQERMRYTIEPIYMLLAAEALMAAATVASRRRKLVEGAAS